MILDDSIRTIMLQFSFTNPSFVPRWVWHKEKEKYGEHKQRKSLKSGVEFIQPTKNVSIVEFLNDLYSEGKVKADSSIYRPCFF